MLTGGCHCGAVRYEMPEAVLHCALCHCSDCRRHAGAPMVSWAIAPAGAQTYDPAFPVCMHVFGPRAGNYYDCSYYTMEQCRMTASGRAAMCDINPYYVGARAPLRHDRRHRRVHY